MLAVMAIVAGRIMGGDDVKASSRPTGSGRRGGALHVSIR